MSKLHFDILSEEQKKTFESLKTFSRHGVLAGGTALALQLFHRKSYDFDIFCKNPISKPFLLKVKNHFKKLQMIMDTADELSIVSPLGVKISFIHYPFRPLYRIIPTQSFGLQSWKDIALDKAYTIGRRGEWRDYIDLCFCIKAGFSLKGIMNGCKKKFRVLFSEKLFLSQLCYFGDIKDFSIDFVNKEVTPLELQNFFEREVKSLGLNPLIS
jgi:hypothetical protein